MSREAAAGRHLTADVTARGVTSLGAVCGRLLATAPTAAQMRLGLVYQSVWLSGCLLSDLAGLLAGCAGEVGALLLSGGCQQAAQTTRDETADVSNVWPWWTLPHIGYEIVWHRS